MPIKDRNGRMFIIDKNERLIMKITELKKMIEIAEQLGEKDIEVCINDCRDGEESYPAARCIFTETAAGKKILTMVYE